MRVGDIDDTVTVFLWEKLFGDCEDHHAPIKSRRVKGMPTPWVSVKLLELRRDRDFHLFKLSVSLENVSQAEKFCKSGREIPQITVLLQAN